MKRRTFLMAATSGAAALAGGGKALGSFDLDEVSHRSVSTVGVGHAPRRRSRRRSHHRGRNAPASPSPSSVPSGDAVRPLQQVEHLGLLPSRAATALFWLGGSFFGPLGAFFAGLAFFPDLAFEGATWARCGATRAFLVSFGSPPRHVSDSCAKRVARRAFNCRSGISYEPPHVPEFLRRSRARFLLCALRQRATSL
jgi:hypothetical protein